MQNVKNFIQSKALGVAEYMTPVLKVSKQLTVHEHYPNSCVLSDTRVNFMHTQVLGQLGGGG